MKAIEIKSELKVSFIKSCRLAGLQFKELKKLNCRGRIYFRVTKVNISQHDIFKLGVYFSQLTYSVEE